MSIYNNAAEGGSAPLAGSAPKTGGLVSDIKDGFQGAAAFKQSRPAQGVVAVFVVVVCLTLWLNLTASGEDVLADVGLAPDSREMLQDACTKATAEASTISGGISPYDIPVCQCVMDIDALKANRNGRKTSVAIEPTPGQPVRRCLCLVFPLPSWLRCYICLVFSLPSWLRRCLCLVFAEREHRRLPYPR
jgi:hypothetical protein